MASLDVVAPGSRPIVTNNNIASRELPLALAAHSHGPPTLLWVGPDGEEMA